MWMWVFASLSISFSSFVYGLCVDVLQRTLTSICVAGGGDWGMCEEEAVGRWNGCQCLIYNL